MVTFMMASHPIIHEIRYLHLINVANLRGRLGTRFREVHIEAFLVIQVTNLLKMDGAD